MSSSTSPIHFSGFEEPAYYDFNFTKDISQKMQVPKKIKATGEVHYASDDDGLTNGVRSWDNANEKINMQVPERIVVVGQEQHMGIKAQPMEIMMENSSMPNHSNLGTMRVSTPPRVLTLNDHYFPSADDYASEDPPAYSQHGNIIDLETGRKLTREKFLKNELNRPLPREATPPICDGITPSEEVLHLRRQMAKLNRRVLAIELDYLQRQQREKIIYAVGIAYILLKAVFWLNRS